MIRGFHHVALSTPDLDRICAFYIDHFGFALAGSFGWPVGQGPVADLCMGLEGSGADVRLLHRDGFYLEVFRFEAPPQAPLDFGRKIHQLGVSHMCFRTDDIDGDYARLKAAGCPFNAPPQDRGAHKLAFLRDPDGNIIELLEVVADPHPFGWSKD